MQLKIIPKVFAIFVFAFFKHFTKLWSQPHGDRVNGEKLHSPFLHWPGAKYSPVTSKHISWLLKLKIKNICKTRLYITLRSYQYVDLNPILSTCTCTDYCKLRENPSIKHWSKHDDNKSAIIRLGRHKTMRR